MNFIKAAAAITLGLSSLTVPVLAEDVLPAVCYGTVVENGVKRSKGPDRRANLTFGEASVTVNAFGYSIPLEFVDNTRAVDPYGNTWAVTNDGSDLFFFTQGVEVGCTPR